MCWAIFSSQPVLKVLVRISPVRLPVVRATCTLQNVMAMTCMCNDFTVGHLDSEHAKFQARMCQWMEKGNSELLIDRRLIMALQSIWVHVLFSAWSSSYKWVKLPEADKWVSKPTHTAIRILFHRFTLSPDLIPLRNNRSSRELST